MKVIEIEPINFLLRSAREQRNIIYSFVSYLKIAPMEYNPYIDSEGKTIPIDRIEVIEVAKDFCENAAV